LILLALKVKGLLLPLFFPAMHVFTFTIKERIFTVRIDFRVKAMSPFLWGYKTRVMIAAVSLGVVWLCVYLTV
jgi:hypothetical protein